MNKMYMTKRILNNCYGILSNTIGLCSPLQEGSVLTSSEINDTFTIVIILLCIEPYLHVIKNPMQYTPGLSIKQIYFYTSDGDVAGTFASETLITCNLYIQYADADAASDICGTNSISYPLRYHHAPHPVPFSL